jgi:predicted MFS family arabinose efflux permease
MSMLFMHSLFGWRGAFVGAAIVGTAVAALLFFQRNTASEHAVAKASASPSSAATWKLLLSPPILLSVVLFMLLFIANVGLQSYSVVALGALYGTQPIVANTALSANLVCNACGVLLGGWIAGHTTHHGWVAAFGLACTAIAVITLGWVDPNAFSLIVLMSIAGLCAGMIMPSRDMLIRAVTPPGAYGKVFGFVTNGFSLAGIVTPLIFGALMDNNAPRTVFMLIGACSLAAMVTVVGTPKRRSA